MPSCPSIENIDSIASQLRRIETSSIFVSAPGQVKLLNFLVKETLEGRQASLKETYIGVMVYGQHPTYDPKTNSVVRVSANRLRTKLQQYYEQAGSDYEVKIELPKGTYVPSFQRIESLSEDPELLPEGNLLSNKSNVEAVPTSDARFRNRQVSWVAVVLPIFALIFTILWNFRHKKSLVRGFFDRNTTTQVLTMEVGSSFDPAISPDGKHLAYVWGGPDGNNYDIYIRDLYGSIPKRMTQSPAQDLHPAWSPDQSVLAYLRSTPRGGEIRQLSLQGEDRKITEIAGYTESVAYPLHNTCSVGPVWSFDGRHLLFSEQKDSTSSLVLLDLRNGNRQTLTETKAPAQECYPIFSADGTQIAFIRYESSFAADLYVLDLNTKAIRRLTQGWGNMRGVTWDPDGQDLILTGNRFKHGVSLWRIPQEGGEPLEIPAGTRHVYQPFFSPKAQMLAFTSYITQTDIAIFSLKEPQQAHVLFPSPLRSDSAQFSPNGKRIAFLTDRLGHWQIWMGSPDGSGLFQLTHLSGERIGALRWSPDGQRLAIDINRNNKVRVVLIDADTGGAVDLASTGFEGSSQFSPTWSADGKSIYFTSDRGGRSRLWKAEINGRSASPILSEPVQQSWADRTGRYLYYVTSEPGIWRLPLDGGHPQLVPELRTVYPAGNWDLMGDAIYFIDSQDINRRIKRYDLTHRTLAFSTSHVPRVIFDTPSLSVDPTGTKILYTQGSAQNGSTIYGLVHAQ
jgi:Tol biopolymer transport system component